MEFHLLIHHVIRKPSKRVLLITLLLPAVLVAACDDRLIFNNPHKALEYNANIRYAAFAERPKTLDPARSYSHNESLFTAQIYEPPLQYHYLKRPYTLIPLIAESLPGVKYIDSNRRILSSAADPNKIVYSVYDIQIKPGIFYQPHPAFAKNPDGSYYYHHLTTEDLRSIYQISDFRQTGTRELVADDYLYQIKRLAHPGLNSPIYGLMEKYILGLSEFAETLQQFDRKAVFTNLTRGEDGVVDGIDKNRQLASWRHARDGVQALREAAAECAE